MSEGPEPPLADLGAGGTGSTDPGDLSAGGTDRIGCTSRAACVDPAARVEFVCELQLQYKPYAVEGRDKVSPAPAPLVQRRSSA